MLDRNRELMYNYIINREEKPLMSRFDMMYKVAKRWGFEAEMTIWFCRLAERKDVDDSIITMAFVVALNTPIGETS